MVTVIDGRNLIHGRLASVVAERIMDGEEIVVLNAEAIVITGVKEQVFADFKAKVDRGDTTKRKGPFYPRRADLLFKRCEDHRQIHDPGSRFQIPGFQREMIPWLSA